MRLVQRNQEGRFGEVQLHGDLCESSSMNAEYPGTLESVIIYYGNLTFVLKPTMNEEYNLIGHAYLLGIMGGLAVSGSLETRSSKEYSGIAAVR